jgi:hypothetical protein
MYRFYMTIAILILSGCASHVIRSGPNGVAIEPVMLYPDMDEIQKLADSECAKYGRIAQLQTGRSSRDRSAGSVLSILGGVPSEISAPRGSMFISPIFGFKCVDRPLAAPDSPLEWPQLQ